MFHLSRRFLLVYFMAAATLVSVLPIATADAQTGNWEYVPELGGYLDWDTGLVWGEHSMNVMYPNFAMGWNYANSTYLPWYRSQTGIAAWRLPTVAEAQVAAAHGINPVINNRWPLIPCWTSETAKIMGQLHAYAVILSDGTVVTGFIDVKKVRGDAYHAVPVYRAFTP